MDYFKRIFNKEDTSRPKTNQSTSIQQNKAPVRAPENYSAQNQTTSQIIPNNKLAANNVSQPLESHKVNVFSSQNKQTELTARPVAKVESAFTKKEPVKYQEHGNSQIVPPKSLNTNNKSKIEDKRLVKQESTAESESMKRIITKMGREESHIYQKLEGLEKRSFPTPFPNQPSFPDTFSNALQMVPVSNEQLHNFSKQRLDNRRQQKEVFMNYKQETDFYRRFIPMNEVKKQRLNQEIVELKQRSMMQDENNESLQEDELIQKELAEIERLKNLAQQSQNNQFSNNPVSYQQIQTPRYSQNNNMPINAPVVQEIDYNPYNSRGYQQRMHDMSGNYHNTSQQYSQQTPQNNPSGYYQKQQIRPSYGNQSMMSYQNNNAPHEVNDKFNPSYNLTAFMNKDVIPPANEGSNMINMPISQQIDAHMQNNTRNYVKQPSQSNTQSKAKSKSNVNANNPLLNMI